METPTNALLLKLSESGFTLTDTNEDIRGFKVLDHQGEDIGEIDDLMIDDRERKVRFLLVGAGGFLGLGTKKFMVPIEAVTRIHDGHVHLDRAREHVAQSPHYAPDIVPLDQTAAGTVYSHYGFPPYWGAGYVYPPYPYFV